MMSWLSKKMVTCSMCHKEAEEDDPCGELYIHGRHAAHHKCLLYSSALIQKTGDFDDFGGGFEVKSVLKEIQRGKKLRCSRKGCEKRGATVGCGKTTCRRTYHYLCAKQEGKFQQKQTDHHINYEIIFNCKEHVQVTDLIRGSSKSGYSSDSDDDDGGGDDDDDNETEDEMSSTSDTNSSEDFVDSSPLAFSQSISSSYPTTKTEKPSGVISRLSRKKFKVDTKRNTATKRKLSYRPGKTRQRKKVWVQKDLLGSTSLADGKTAEPPTAQDLASEVAVNDHSSSSSRESTPLVDERSLNIRGMGTTDRMESCHDNSTGNKHTTSVIAGAVARAVSQFVAPQLKDLRSEVDTLKEQVGKLQQESALSPRPVPTSAQVGRDHRKARQSTPKAASAQCQFQDQENPDESVTDISLESCDFRCQSQGHQHHKFPTETGKNNSIDENFNRVVPVTRHRRSPFSDEALAGWYSLQSCAMPENELKQKEKAWGTSSVSLKNKLKPPDMPKMIQDQLDKTSRDQDKLLYEVCQGYHHAMAPLLCVASSSDDMSKAELEQAIRDAISLMGFAAYKAARSRQNLLKEVLKPEYHRFCDFQPSHEHLFGNQLIEERLQQDIILIEESRRKETHTPRATPSKKKSTVKSKRIDSFFAMK
ncbi:uncharacterized protein [Ptychodera flava]|uniref:uncharacterized protein isoform X2 n=1 Tax=Ptychodera flava TaxID=63121 RepID=UPI00396A0F86